MKKLSFVRSRNALAPSPPPPPAHNRNNPHQPDGPSSPPSPVEDRQLQYDIQRNGSRHSLPHRHHRSTARISALRQLTAALGLHRGKHIPSPCACFRTNRSNDLYLRCERSPATQWTLEARVFDDGVAYRYRIPGAGARKVNREASEWALPNRSRIWYQRHNTGKTTRCGFRRATKCRFRSAILVAAPMTVKLPDEQGYAFSRANLVNYPTWASGRPSLGNTRLSLHQPKGFTPKAKFSLPGGSQSSQKLNTLVTPISPQSLPPRARARRRH